MAISDKLYLQIVDNVSSISPEILATLESSIESGPGSSVDVNLFKDAINKTSDPAQRQYILQAYLALAYGNKIDDFDGCLKVLTHIFNECGLTESDNPFVTYLNLDGGKYAKPLTSNSLLLLNNLYADELIEAVDIQGRSDMRTNHPIFKENFFKVEDPYFTMKSYNWLSNLSKLKQLNYGALANWPRLSDDDVLKILSQSISNKESTSMATSKEIYVTDPEKLKDIDVLTFRTAFINGGSGDMDYDSFRDTEELKNILNLASKETRAETDDTSKEKKTKVDTNIEAIKKSISNLTKEDTLKLIKSVISTYGIDKYDLYY